MASTFSASTLPKTQLFTAITSNDPSTPAVVHSDSGETFSYGDLARDIAATKHWLQTEVAGSQDITGQRVAFLIENSYDYVGPSSACSKCAPQVARLTMLYSHFHSHHRRQRHSRTPCNLLSDT